MPRRVLASFSVLTLYFTSVLAPLAQSPPAQRPTPATAGQARRSDATDAASAQARAALAKGKDLLRRNRPEQALVSLTTAGQLLKQAGDALGEAAAHDTLGDLYTQTGQYRLALPEYQRAQELLRAAHADTDANLVTAQLGDLYYLAGQTAEAGMAYQQVNARRAEAAAGAGASATNDASVSPAQLVVPVSGDERRLLDLINGARRTNGLSALRWDNQLAQMARRHAENMARTGSVGHVDQDGLDTGARASAFGIRDYEALAENISVVAVKEQDPVAAAVAYWLSDEIHRTNILDGSLTHTGLGMARAADGQVLFAEVFTRAGTAAPGNLPYRDFIAYADSEFGLGRIAYASARLDEAQRHFENVLAAADAASPIGKLAQPRRFRAAALTSLGDVALRRDNYPEALRQYAVATGGARKDARPDLSWAAQRGTGRAYWLMAAREPDPQKAAQLRAAALTAYQQAVGTIEEFLLGSSPADEARKTFLATTQEVYAEAAGAQAEMALTAADQSAPLAGPALTYATTALQTVEQGRARDLLDMLGDGRAELSAGIAPGLLEQKAAMQARQREIAELIAGVRLGEELTVPAAAALEAEFDNLELRYRDLEKQIRAASPRYAALTRPQPLTVAAMQQDVLDEGTVLLEYNLGDEHSYLWVVTRGDLRLFRLPARSIIEAKAQQLRSQLLPASLRRSLASTDGLLAEPGRGLGLNEAQAQTPAATTAAAAVQAYVTVASDLYDVLVAPAAPYVRAKRLLIVAAGATNFIPFGALVSDKAGDSYAALDYLVKSNEIIYAPSASVLAAIRRQARGPAAAGQMLIMADPVFDAADPRAQTVAARMQQSGGLRSGLRFQSALDDISGGSGGGQIRLPRLRGTRVEAEQIARLASASGGAAATMLDLKASETALGQQPLGRYSVLHFATHGLLDPVRPQFTGLALSLVGDDDNDGFLQVGEIFNLRLHTSLVMLSACETGLGELRRGEGVSGLAQGFMYAGASTVGVSLWSISDDATAELMPGFYSRLMSKECPSTSASLRAAQLELMARGRYSAPFYWAPFILVGDWR